MLRKSEILASSGVHAIIVVHLDDDVFTEIGYQSAEEDETVQHR